MGKKNNSVKETAEERALAEVASKRWAVYKEHYAPAIDTYISKVRKDDNDRDYGKAEVNSGLMSAYNKMERDAIDSGFNPTHGYGASRVLNPLTAISHSTEMNNIDDQITDIHYRGLESVARLGQGVASNAVQGLSDLASDASDVAIHNTMQKEQRRRDNITGAMQLAGAGTAAYQNYYPQSPGVKPGQMPQHIPGNPTVTPMGNMQRIKPQAYVDYNGTHGGIYG